MIAQQSLLDLAAYAVKGRRHQAFLPQPVRSAHALRHACIGFVFLVELVSTLALAGAAWSPLSITFGNGSYTRQASLPPPAPNAGHAAWLRYEQRQFATDATTVPTAKSAQITLRPMSSATPAAISTPAVPVPVAAPTPTK